MVCEIRSVRNSSPKGFDREANRSTLRFRTQYSANLGPCSYSQVLSDHLALRHCSTDRGADHFPTGHVSEATTLPQWRRPQMLQMG
jgi:hypothetical protein